MLAITVATKLHKKVILIHTLNQNMKVSSMLVISVTKNLNNYNYYIDITPAHDETI